MGAPGLDFEAWEGTNQRHEPEVQNYTVRGLVRSRDRFVLSHVPK